MQHVAIPVRRVVARALSKAREYDEHADAVGSYYDAVAAIGERVKAGEEVPEFFRSTREAAR